MQANPLLIILVAMCEATGIGLLGSVLLRRFPLAQPLLGVVLITLVAMITSTGVVVLLFGFSPAQAAVELSAACVAALVSLNVGVHGADGTRVTGGEPGRDLDLPRRDIVAHASHDLRAPLARLRATVESAQADAPLDQRDHLGRISSDLDRLGDRLDDLLRLSRFQSGGLHPRPDHVELADLARDVTAGFRAAHRGTSVRVDAGPCVVRADRPLLEEVLTTLVADAIHHCGPGGAVTITIGGDAAWATASVDAERRAADEADPLGRRDGIRFALAEEIVHAHRGALTTRQLPHGHHSHVRLPRT
ncbi:HAMP domain-containing sensor histidine kinase [Saccharopolyspora sp. NFXS83]|uniref:sensor histidine kinase n=1 Tax=Saccharopolyspora sp. NFXS83 TaxID=2993560 RepID=UPI00224B9F7A|nr:HAMP domain-containing sensor histidine kinase [Saccharopolyspora sp. NFXS83]MCX2730118.1 HAMP domain-containing sensor histidine kinase [Saccharopolyspora sp. NFXS83]